MFHNTLYRFPRGRSRLLSPARTFVSDLVYFAKQVPSVPVERRMHLAEVVEARQRWPKRVSWRCIFTKAMAILSTAPAGIAPGIHEISGRADLRSVGDYR